MPDQPAAIQFMRQVSEQAIAASYTRLQRLPDRQVGQLADALPARQPELCAFLLETTSDLQQDVHELGYWILCVLILAFEQTAGRKLPRIKPGALERAHARLEQHWAGLEHADPGTQARHAGVFLERQPHVLHYIVGTLLDDEDAGELAPLTDREAGTLMLSLMICVVCLDEALQKALR